MTRHLLQLMKMLMNRQQQRGSPIPPSSFSAGPGPPAGAEAEPGNAAPCLPFCANTARGRTGRAAERNELTGAAPRTAVGVLAWVPGERRGPEEARLCVHGEASSRDLFREDAHPFDELFWRTNDADRQARQPVYEQST